MYLPVHAHDPSRAAKSALGTIILSKGLLYWVVAFSSVTDALDRGNLPVLSSIDAHQTLGRNLYFRILEYLSYKTYNTQKIKLIKVYSIGISYNISPI